MCDTLILSEFQALCRQLACAVDAEPRGGAGAVASALEAALAAAVWHEENWWRPMNAQLAAEQAMFSRWLERRGRGEQDLILTTWEARQRATSARR